MFHVCTDKWKPLDVLSAFFLAQFICFNTIHVVVRWYSLLNRILQLRDVLIFFNFYCFSQRLLIFSAVDSWRLYRIFIFHSHCSIRHSNFCSILDFVKLSLDNLSNCRMQFYDFSAFRLFPSVGSIESHSVFHASGLQTTQRPA